MNFSTVLENFGDEKAGRKKLLQHFHLSHDQVEILEGKAWHDLLLSANVHCKITEALVEPNKNKSQSLKSRVSFTTFSFLNHQRYFSYARHICLPLECLHSPEKLAYHSSAVVNVYKEAQSFYEAATELFPYEVIKSILKSFPPTTNEKNLRQLQAPLSEYAAELIKYFEENEKMLKEALLFRHLEFSPELAEYVYKKFNLSTNYVRLSYIPYYLFVKLFHNLKKQEVDRVDNYRDFFYNAILKNRKIAEFLQKDKSFIPWLTKIDASFAKEINTFLLAGTNLDIANELLESANSLSNEHIQFLAESHLEIAERLIIDPRLDNRVWVNWGRIYFQHPTLFTYVKSAISISLTGDNLDLSSLPENITCQFFKTDQKKIVDGNNITAKYPSAPVFNIQPNDAWSSTYSSPFSNNQSFNNNFYPTAERPHETAPNTKFLYSSNQKTRLNKLDDRNNQEAVDFEMSPIFELISQNTDSYDKLSYAMGMSLNRIISYDENNTPVEVEPLTDTVVPVSKNFDKQQNDVQLKLIDCQSLDKFMDDYIIPKLSPKQILTKCEGGVIFEDKYGRWLLDVREPDKLIIEIALSLQTVLEDVIDIQMINDSSRKDIFSFQATVDTIKNKYSVWESENTYCGDRTREIIRLSEPEIRKNLLFAISGDRKHAYLFAKYDALNQTRYVRINLGGIADHTETYSPFAEDNQENNSEKKEYFTQLAELLSHLPSGQALLLECSLPRLVSHLVHTGNLTSDNHFITEEFCQFDYDQPTVKSRADFSCFWEENGDLYDFINQAYQNSETDFYWVIQWDKLTPNQRVRLNTIPEGVVQGRTIPKNIRIISVTEKSLEECAKDDDAFTTRHPYKKKIADTEWPPQNAQKPIALPVEYCIDLQGLNNWKEALFGRIVQQGKVSRWTPSGFAQDLLDGKIPPNTFFKLINAPSTEAIQEINHYLELSVARGYCRYHNKNLAFSGTPFFQVELLKLSAINVSTIFTAQTTEAPVYLNTYMFEHLLEDKEIKQKQYYALVGLLEQKKESTLAIAITSSLTDAQWHILLSNAKKYHVTLDIRCASHVVLPAALHGLPVRPLIVDSTKKLPCYYTEKISNFEKNDPETLIIDMEDISYQQLFFMENHEMKEGNFENFSIQPTELLQWLASGKRVVLRGKISSPMLHYLHPILATGIIEQSGQKFFIEDPSLLSIIIETDSTKELQELAWLSPEKVETKNIEQPSKKIVIEEVNTLEIDWDNPKIEAFRKEDAEQFMNNRKSLLLNILEESPWVVLPGEKGIGKTEIVNELERDGMLVSRGLEELNDWKDKYILFLDEASSLNKHGTQLSPLATGEGGPCYHDGKISYISPSHKVILALNPEEYGGGRTKLTLLSRHSIPELRLGKLHLAYIYHEILLPLYTNASDYLHNQISQKEFGKKCLELLVQINQDKLSVRGAKEELQLFLSSKVHEYLEQLRSKQREALQTVGLFTFQEHKKSSTLDQEQEKMRGLIQKKLDLYTDQKLGHLDTSRGSIRGLLLVGESGIGKSTTIRNTLEESGMNYIKLDTKNLSSIKQQLKEAYKTKEPPIIWIDEVNSILETIDNGPNKDLLEKWLNNLMTGKEPESGKTIEGKQPCLLLCSMNDADREGRSELSPALLDRFDVYHAETTFNYRNITLN